MITALFIFITFTTLFALGGSTMAVFLENRIFRISKFSLYVTITTKGTILSGRIVGISDELEMSNGDGSFRVRWKDIVQVWIQ